jgi:tRNA 2-selenouridine synthase
VQKLVNLLLEEKFEEAVGILLADYYDPLYKYPAGPDGRYNLSVNTGDTVSAVDAAAGYITSLPEYGVSVSGGVLVGNRESIEDRQGK